MIKIDPKGTTASMDVDAQNCFTTLCPDELPVPQAHEIATELNKQSSFARYRIGSKQVHPANAIWIATKEKPSMIKVTGENVDIRWPAHCISGTQCAELIKGLPHPADYDYFVWKGVEPDMHPYGSCYHDLKEKLSTGIIEFLKSKEVKTVIVGGLTTDYCIKNTVMQLLRNGFHVIVNMAACRGLDPKTIQEALQEMRKQGAILIQSSQELQQHT